METTKTETGTESGIVTEIIEGEKTLAIRIPSDNELLNERFYLAECDGVVSSNVERFPARVTSSSARRSDRRAATTVTVACLE